MSWAMRWRLAASLRGLTGWRRLAVTFAAGLISALGFAPFGFFPGLVLGLTALVLVLDGARASARPIRDCALTGWAFGFGQFLLGLHWIAYAFLVDADDHLWQIPFVAVLFPGGLALFVAAAAGAYAALKPKGTARLFLFALCYGLAEWLRGHIFTGFPWNVAAYGWVGVPAVLQSVSLFGSETLSLLTALLGASLAELFAFRPRWSVPAALTGLFLLLGIGGAVRLASTPSPTVPGVRLRLVQPDIPQTEKYQRRYVIRNWRRLIDLSEKPGNPTVIIWPEAAAPFLLDEQPLALARIARLTANSRVLMTGALRRDLDIDGTWHYANSFFVFDQAGRITTVYDKSHLVPFAEYLPFEKTLSALGLQKLTGIDGSFTPGGGTVDVAVPGAGTATPLICYEILFPGEIMPAHRPDWFVNITDDSWFGPWAGPLQHLAVARLRAIEQGVPVVRAANTGISAVIDPLGRITARLDTGRIGVVDAALPAAIARTWYSRFGVWWFWLVLCATGVAVWLFPKGK